ncbi:uncharacterized protein L203_103779 [Cryptococcus depauperatus CBS 7841]|uniref:Uncharacterized protein n=1 Tax=Cryptococcus depauperatus CBS 7841 TaxID=1295531 RepID=A0A1E3IEG1_9TREE|nr:hypothetical protein L203_03722 [Cryptococcus depauperatus CBS 7841]
MITYAPKTFSVQRLFGLCRQAGALHGLSSMAVTPVLAHSSKATITMAASSKWTEAKLRNKIERARQAMLRRTEAA